MRGLGTFRRPDHVPYDVFNRGFGMTIAPAALGKLDRVDLRTVWETEAGAFTPWLAREDNLALLGETVGIELELEAQEKDVGPFRADLLCKDTASGAWVLVENQLERTDHTHLGQLLTYAAGLQAVTIVWVAARFTEEHRATLDWLNEITDDRFNFFGLEVELWRIGTSPVAPEIQRRLQAERLEQNGSRQSQGDRRRGTDRHETASRSTIGRDCGPTWTKPGHS